MSQSASTRGRFLRIFLSSRKSCFHSSFSLRNNKRKFRCFAIVSAERPPCFQFARRHFSIPWGVRGPVDLPPCFQHLVYPPALLLHIAGAWQGVPVRVKAKHRGDLRGSPDGFPFFSLPMPLQEFTAL